MGFPGPGGTPPKRMLMVTCSACGSYLGIEDVDRIQHEHFNRTYPPDHRCHRGHYVWHEYEMTRSDFDRYAPVNPAGEEK